jgi:hypothetical protein
MTTNHDSHEFYGVKQSQHGVAPFVALPLKGAGIELTEIVLGPRLPKENLQSFEWLKRKHGLESIRISQSTLAYR